MNIEFKPGEQLRRTRSFILRQGRLTPGQERALKALWPIYGIDFSERAPQVLDLTTLFATDQPITVEIGFGNGESLVEMAASHPERNFIGIEVHTPGVGHCLLGIEHYDLRNLKLMQADAVEVLKHAFLPESLDKVQIFFPDPWHKKRHHKRRIIQPAFVELVTERLQSGGRLHVATDWAEYAEHIHEVLSQSRLTNTASNDDWLVPSPTDRPETKFERRGHKLGHHSHDLLYMKC